MCSNSESHQNFIDAAFYAANEHRILFAVTVDTIECWLLPLLYNDKKAAKTTGCLESANRALRKADQDALAAGENTFIPAYEKASRGYLKRKTLNKLRNKNPSLELFIKQLDSLHSRLSANRPADGQGQDRASPGGEKPPGDNSGDQPE